MSITVQYTVWCEGVLTEAVYGYGRMPVAEVGDRCVRWEYVDGRNKAEARADARLMGWQELPDGTHRCPVHRTER